MFKKTSAVPALTLAAYVAKDCVGALLTFPISSGSQMPNTSATIKRLTMIDAAIQDEEYFLHLFTASPAAAARTDADECVRVAADLVLAITTLHIESADFHTMAGDSIATYELDTAVVFDGLNLYGVLECVATPDYVAADDLTVNLIVEI